MAKKPNYKAVLYIAYHYPPVLGSSGVHRTLAFTRHLNDNGWDTSVLTASLKGYDNWSQEQFKFIPDGINVIRAFCRNTSKHFSFKGKYLSWMALPDNWQSWIVGGVISGLNTIRKNRPDVIVSTYPIASAHIIAYVLHKLTGVPWVADLRDPMAQDDYPSDPRKKKIFEWIERKAVKHCSNVILTAPGAVDFYRSKFPQVDKDFWQLVPNGFDQTLFENLMPDELVAGPSAKASHKLVLLHSGVIYPSERDPSSLFAALAELKTAGVIDEGNFELRLRATGHDANYQPVLKTLGIDSLVKLEPPIPYQAALNEMLDVDALLLLQAENCNYQIPAKAYEYIRVQKPILALTPEEGDTGKLLLKTGTAWLAPLDDKAKIVQAMSDFLVKVRTSEFTPLSDDDANRYSRQHHAIGFEELLLSACLSKKD